MFINNTQRETKEERNKRDREQTVPTVQNQVVGVDCWLHWRCTKGREGPRQTDRYNSTVLEFDGNSTVHKEDKDVLSEGTEWSWTIVNLSKIHVCQCHVCQWIVRPHDTSMSRQSCVFRQTKRMRFVCLCCTLCEIDKDRVVIVLYDLVLTAQQSAQCNEDQLPTVTCFLIKYVTELWLSAICTDFTTTATASRMHDLQSLSRVQA